MNKQKFNGIWPVVPTSFKDDGAVDYPSVGNILDCMIDQGVDGGCILANYSEQFLISDEERLKITKKSLEHVKGRLPLIVTISHFATKIAVERAKFAKEQGAVAVMLMPPYHGALLKGSEQQTFQQVQAVGEVGLPIMLQDAPLSGVELSVDFLIKMAKEVEMVKMFKIESINAAEKLRNLIGRGGENIEGPFDGEEGITLLADLDAGAVGSMTSALIPDLIRPVILHHRAGDRDMAESIYHDILPIINFENRQCGFRATKYAMKKGGVISSDFSRHPVAPLNPTVGEALLDLLRPKKPVVLEWGK
ncbi:MAG: dihydrodipicolinate synthase family protein [Proteobacteria bacterium]|nr:dihydrodipicolinate synthase family protein [Pseudomonadota bacterium]